MLLFSFSITKQYLKSLDRNARGSQTVPMLRWVTHYTCYLTQSCAKKHLYTVENSGRQTDLSLSCMQCHSMHVETRGKFLRDGFLLSQFAFCRSNLGLRLNNLGPLRVTQRETFMLSCQGDLGNWPSTLCPHKLSSAFILPSWVASHKDS